MLPKILQHRSRRLILWFDELWIKDVPLVGGKNASLGEMYQRLSPKGVNVPNGFAITAFAYQEFLKENKLNLQIIQILNKLDSDNIHQLQKAGSDIRKLITGSKIPYSLEQEILESYAKLSRKYKVEYVDVAVRSSATAEDLPDASFAGQQATFLNINSPEALLTAVKDCFASLFTDRAISYRKDKGFNHMQVSLSVGIQKMVRSDKACSGIMFTLDPDTGFKDVCVINGSWGLGELIVQGEVIPDEYHVFKPTFTKGYPSIIKKDLGTKQKMLIYGQGSETKLIQTPLEKQHQFVLSEEEVLTLSKWAVQIENHYKKPMDTEWAKDGLTGELYIVQARPETIHGSKKTSIIESFEMTKPGNLIIKGSAVGTKIAKGKAHIIKSAKQIDEFKPGEVLITRITDPDWEPIMKIASAIITDEGGRTSHAAIVSRELGIPCIVGTEKATAVIKNKELVTVDCSSGTEGYVYTGETKWEVKTFKVNKLKKLKTKIMVNVGSPNEAYKVSFIPNDGVGLAREEFIIASQIKVHPLALLHFDDIKDASTRHKIEQATLGYSDKSEFYVEKLAEGIAQIGAAFYPNPVIVRFSDFKTNEYSSLLGGSQFEPSEENPMIGWRGASRYYDPRFEEAFGLECEALKIVRKFFGLTNVVPMVPFCRTVDEGKKVLGVMRKYGLKRGVDGLKVYMMAEIPSNIILAEKFLQIFDGMSIGSNDLTQLTLGLDRDNGGLSSIGNEQNEAVKELIEYVIKKAKKNKKYIGICGQAPSDFPDFAKFLVKLGISSISLNPDSVLKTTLAIQKQEKALH